MPASQLILEASRTITSGYKEFASASGRANDQYIDHTLVDVIVVDEDDRLPIGRPWLTLAIDVASRAVLGFSVSLEGPSVVSVALTLVQAVLPKDLWLADRQLEVPWPMWGLPELLQLDNAAEFHSRALVVALRSTASGLITGRQARRTLADTSSD